jgi:hypothetical protein
MNPAMSSWVALRRRVIFEPGQTVLVLGATGNAGRMAVQVAKHLGASHVIGAGRHARAHRAWRRQDRLSRQHLWRPTPRPGSTRRRRRHRLPLGPGHSRCHGRHRHEPHRPALRAARLQIVGSGQSSVSTRDFLAELPDLAVEITNGAFQIDARAVPLADVENAWNDTDTTQRIVITP